jgi:hypothetical protein
MMTDLKRIFGSAFESVLFHVPMPGADGSHKPGKCSLKARAEEGQIGLGFSIQGTQATFNIEALPSNKYGV